MSETRGFAGTGALVRLALRRDRVRIPMWVGGIVGVLYLSAAAERGLYDTQAQIDAYANVVGQSPAAVAMAGPALGLHTIQGIVMYETWLTAIAAVSIMAVMLVARHTRAEEESGRTELVRATEVGRHAGAASALIVTGATCVLVGLGMALTLPATPLGFGSSTVYGAAMAVLGLVMASLTLCFAQLFVHARSTTGAGLAAFLVFYVIRAVGDVRHDWTVWLSPVGWVQATHIPTENRWWPLLVPLAASAALVGGAMLLTNRRDFGGGLLPTLAGPDRAAASLTGPVGLAWRMQRSSLLAWSLALAACGVMVGTLGTSMQGMIKENPDLAAYLAIVEGGSIIDAYQATLVLILALVVGAFGVWSAGRVVPDEGQGRLELLLAGPLARTRSLLGDLLVTLAGVTILLCVSGVSTGMTYAAVAGDLDQGVKVSFAPLVYLPAILILVGVTVLTYGWAPHWTWVGWLVLAFETVIGWLGGLLKPPGWVVELSVFDRAPRYPLEALAWSPLLAMLAVALALTAVGWVGFRRRDIGRDVG